MTAGGTRQRRATRSCPGHPVPGNSPARQAAACCPACMRASATNPRTTSRRLLAAASSRASARTTARMPSSMRPLTASQVTGGSCCLISVGNDVAAGHRLDVRHNPGVAVVEVPDQPHQVGIFGDVLARRLGIDRAPDRSRNADDREVRLDERKTKLVLERDRRACLLYSSTVPPLARMAASILAVSNRPRATSSGRAFGGIGRVRGAAHRRDDAVDVGLDVDAGFRLELIGP